MSYYTTYFQLRVKNSGGTVLYTFKPHDSVRTDVDVERGEAVVIERMKALQVNADYHLGYKQRVGGLFTAIGKSITAATGYATLEVVLNAHTTGGTLEYSVDGGSTWVPCVLEGDPDRFKQEGQNYTEQVRVSCISKECVATPWRTS